MKKTIEGYYEEWKDVMGSGRIPYVPSIQEDNLIRAFCYWTESRIREETRALMTVEKELEESVEEALSEAVYALYFGARSNSKISLYEISLRDIVRELGGEEAETLLEESPTEAYEKYCS